jgi:hypothetical protein
MPTGWNSSLRERGYHTVVFNGGFVEHLERESLSRSKERISKFIVENEYNLLLFGVKGFGLAVEAIENVYEPREVGRRSLEIKLEAKAKYG